MTQEGTVQKLLNSILDDVQLFFKESFAIDVFDPDNYFMVILALTLGTLIWTCIRFIFKAFILYTTSKRSGDENAWMSFIPIVQTSRMYHMAGLSENVFYALYVVRLVSGVIAILSAIVSIVYLISNYYVKWRTAKNFGCGALGCFFMLFFPMLTLIYILLTHKEYNPTPVNPKLASLLDNIGL